MIPATAYDPATRTFRTRPISDAAASAWHECQFRKILGPHADEMLLDAVESKKLDKAELDLGDGSSTPLMALIVDGSVRVYSTSPQGRQATIRYARRGDVVGLATMLATASIYDGDVVAVQAMTPCHVLRLSTFRFRQIAARDPDVMWGLFGELARTLLSSHHMLADNVFQPVRARVARHLLDLAQRRDGRLVVHASPQDIADAIGSVREVVSRATARLRGQGIILRNGTEHIIENERELRTIARSTADF
jgi:CRP-like cAMP-binding protein